jgi:hypothetical protein
VYSGRIEKCTAFSVPVVIFEGRPESKDRLAIKKNKQNKKINVSLLQTLNYFST